MRLPDRRQFVDKEVVLCVLRILALLELRINVAQVQLFSARAYFGLLFVRQLEHLVGFGMLATLVGGGAEIAKRGVALRVLFQMVAPNCLSFGGAAGLEEDV